MEESKGGWVNWVECTRDTIGEGVGRTFLSHQVVPGQHHDVNERRDCADPRLGAGQLQITIAAAGTKKQRRLKY